MIRIPLTLLPWAIVDAIKMAVSINRIEAFLNAEELNDECVGEALKNHNENTIEIQNASLSWNIEKRKSSDLEDMTGSFYTLNTII